MIAITTSNSIQRKGAVMDRCAAHDAAPPQRNEGVTASASLDVGRFAKNQIACGGLATAFLIENKSQQDKDNRSRRGKSVNGESNNFRKTKEKVRFRFKWLKRLTSRTFQECGSLSFFGIVWRAPLSLGRGWFSVIGFAGADGDQRGGYAADSERRDHFERFE